MNILHIIPYMHPDAGGPPVVVEQLVRNHRAAGHRSVVLTTPLFCNGREEALEAAWRGLAPLEFLPPGRFAALLDRSAREIGARVAESDIVHIHTLWHPINVLARRACRALSRPYVIMPHGMLDPYSLGVGWLKKRVFLALFERSNLTGAERVIYTTAAEQQLAESGLPWLKRGCVVALGGDAPGDVDRTFAREFLEAFPAVKDKRALLFLGRVDFKKGLDRIIAALPSVLEVAPDVVLIIAGSGDESFAEKIRGMIASRGLQNAVVWTGRLSGRVKWGAYSVSELFLLPSRQENFAITVAEAMHMARPVIISDKVNTASDVAAGGAGLVLNDADCDRRLGEAILSLLADGQRARAMGEQGKAYAAAHLTWANTAEQMLSCYQSALEGPRR